MAEFLNHIFFANIFIISYLITYIAHFKFLVLSTIKQLKEALRQGSVLVVEV
jgi:hypothetical protein